MVIGHARVEALVEAVQNTEPGLAEWTALRRVAEALELEALEQDEQLPQVLDDLFFSRLRSREAGNLGAQTDTTHTEQPDAPRRDATRVAALRTDIPSPLREDA